MSFGAPRAMTPLATDPAAVALPAIAPYIRRDAAADWAWFLAAAVVLALSCWWEVAPGTHGGDEVRANGTPIPPTCVLRTVIGVPCLTCGMTRSFVASAHGAWAAAARHHPLGPALFLLTLLQLPYRAFVLFTARGRRTRWPEAWVSRAFWTLVAALSVAWLVRLGT